MENDMRIKYATAALLSILFWTSAFTEEINRHNVPENLANAKRIKTDNLFYAKLGFGGIFGDVSDTGTNFGFGYRHETDSIAVDFSFLNFTFGQSKESAVSCNVIALQGLYFFSPIDNSSWYAGGGLAYNLMGADKETEFGMENYSSNGVAAVATLGYETMRTSNLRLFIQAEATVPFLKMKNDSGNGYYGSSVAVSMGAGF